MDYNSDRFCSFWRQIPWNTQISYNCTLLYYLKNLLYIQLFCISLDRFLFTWLSNSLTVILAFLASLSTFSYTANSFFFQYFFLWYYLSSDQVSIHAIFLFLPISFMLQFFFIKADQLVTVKAFINFLFSNFKYLTLTTNYSLLLNIT